MPVVSKERIMFDRGSMDRGGLGATAPADEATRIGGGVTSETGLTMAY